ncbi:hypothetical protein DICA4_E09714 [Diutina catenulata]
MASPCTPAELVAHTVETLAFSGLTGVSVVEMWAIVAAKMGSELSDAAKQIVWSWLFFDDDSAAVPLYVVNPQGVVVSIRPKYREMAVDHPDLAEYRVLATADAQWEHLTGLRASKKLKMHLGDKPFELLVVIAAHGPQGITSSDLCKQTGQDPRSLPVRFKKLTDMGLIVRRKYYDARIKQQANLSVHTRFVAQNTEETTKSEDAIKLRNSQKFKELLVEKLRVAPDHIRGFRDLKVELQMTQGKAPQKFFGAMVNSLVRRGYIEKIMVETQSEEPGQPKRPLYCLRFLKELPKTDKYDVNFGENGAQDDPDETVAPDDDLGVEESVFRPEALPRLNKFYPLYTQIHREMAASGGVGVPAKEIIRHLTGTAGFRSFVRVLDQLSGYIIDEKGVLTPLKPAPDAPYDDMAIVRSYDFDGKYKFYRYYTRDQLAVPVTAVKPHKKLSAKATPQPPKVLPLSVSQIEKKHGGALAKFPRGGNFLELRKRAKPSPDAKPKPKKLPRDPNEPPRKRGRPRKGEERPKPPVIEDEDEEMEEPVKEEPVPEPEPAKPDDGSFTPQVDHKALQRFLSTTENSSPVIRRHTPPVQGSIKGYRRQQVLLDVLKKKGGAAYTSAKLRRELDEAMGNETTTDNKTLARDISLLIASGKVSVESVEAKRGDSVAKRKIIALAGPDAPSDAFIANLRSQVNSHRDPMDYRSRSDHRVVATATPVPMFSEEEQRRVAAAKDRQLAREERKRLNTIKKSQRISAASEPRAKAPRVKREGAKSGKRAFPKQDASALYRMVVICRTFLPSGIDFDAIAAAFEGHSIIKSAAAAKQKWTSVRKHFGGMPAVLKGVEEFQHIVTAKVNEGFVTAEDLEQGTNNLQFFMDLWSDANQQGANGDDDVFDTTSPLFASVDENVNHYQVSPVAGSTSDIFDSIEDSSMRQKEHMLANHTWYCAQPAPIEPASHDDTRTLVKSVLSVPELDYNGAEVQRVLGSVAPAELEAATTAMIEDKELLYNDTPDAPAKFQLLDKVFAPVYVRSMSPQTMEQAREFSDQMTDVFAGGRGLVLSQAVANGQMMAVLQRVSDFSARLVHVDREYNLEGYESRYLNKALLSCDVVVVKNPDSSAEEPALKPVPVPAGEAGGHMWMAPDGSIKRESWRKIICAVLYYVNTRPGITASTLFRKLSPHLGYRDFFDVMQWLERTQAVEQGRFTGYWAKPRWYGVLG